MQIIGYNDRSEELFVLSASVTVLVVKA